MRVKYCYITGMILVLTPLSFENDHLRPFLGAADGLSDHHGVRVHHFASGVACATGGHGKVQFALTTQMLIRELSPRLVVCAGAGGGISTGLNALDVVAGVQTVEHDFNLRFVKKPLPRFTGDGASLTKLRETSEWPGFRLHFGIVASGDEDIVDAVRAATVRASTEGLVVAWEGAGGARAAAFCKTPYLELRVITDMADGQAPQDFQRNVQAGMKNIAAVLHALR